MTVNPFFLHPQPATKTTATNSKKIIMKHLLKVLSLVNFEFQGILNNSLGGGGVTCGDLASRLEEVKTCSSLDPRISRLPVPEGMGGRGKALGTRLDMLPFTFKI